MNNIALQQDNLKTSAAGNNYWDVKIQVLSKDGEAITRDAKLIINPKWKGDYDKAIAEATRCKTPSFNLLVSDMERAEGDYNGTGSTWCRKPGDHAGNFNFQGRPYTLAVKRNEATEQFELTLDIQPEVDLAQL